MRLYYIQKDNKFVKTLKPHFLPPNIYWEIKRFIVSIINYQNGNNILEIYQALVQI